MKLKQAIDIVESENKVIYPECVKFIEDKIKHLRRQAHDYKRGEAIEKTAYKADEWKEVLKRNHQKIINAVFLDVV